MSHFHKIYILVFPLCFINSCTLDKKSLPSYLQEVYEVNLKMSNFEVVQDEREYYENLGEGTVILKVKENKHDKALGQGTGLDDFVNIRDSYKGAYKTIVTNTYELNIGEKSKTDTLIRIMERGKELGFRIRMKDYPKIKNIDQLRYKVVGLSNPKVIFYYEPEHTLYFFHIASHYEKKDIKEFILF